MLKSKIRVAPCLPLEFDFSGEKIVFTGALSRDKSPKLLPVDQFSGQPFMLNECGWIKNDIQAYEDTQNDSVARAILQRCPVFTQEKPDNLTIDERLSEIIPSNVSSPAEFVRVSKHIAAARYAKQVEREKMAAAAYEKARQMKSEPVKKTVKVETES